MTDLQFLWATVAAAVCGGVGIGGVAVGLQERDWRTAAWGMGGWALAMTGVLVLR